MRYMGTKYFSMPKLPARLRCILALMFLLPGLSRGQEAAGTWNVVDLLRSLETRFEVKFSFADEDLQSMEVTLPPDTPLEETLAQLREQTQLRIQKLNERYYTVVRSETVTVCASVLDNFESNTIPGATIEVLGANIVVVTGAEGQFRLEDIPRSATLRIRHLGYKALYVPVENLLRQHPCTTLLLPVRYQQLPEVVVYKFLTTGLRKEPDGSITMTRSQFGLLPGQSEPDVLQSIQALPGIKSNSETVSDINIRGGTNDQNLLLWDGIRMYQSGHFFGLISAFNPYLTDQVEIIKNGSSAYYGDGLSGIISMSSHNAVERNYFGGAGFNLISGDAYLHLPLSDRLALQVSARRSITDFLNTPTYSNFSDRVFQDTQISNPGRLNSDRFESRDEDFYFYDFSGKVLYDWSPEQQLRLNVLYIRNRLAYNEVLAADGSTNRSTLSQANFGLGGILKSTWNSRLNTEVEGYFTQYDLDSEYQTEQSGQILLQSNQVMETALKTRLSIAAGSGLTWNSGYQFLVTGIANISDVNQPPFVSRIKDVLYTHALFTEWAYQGPGGRLLTTAGVRLNYLTNPDDFTRFRAEPRLSFHYKLSPHLYLQALGETKNQSSLQKVDLEQNFLGIEKRRWILADGRSLPVATSQQGSLGLHYDRGNWLASLEGFYKKVDDITTDTQGFQNEDQFDGEIGDYRVYGMEALLNFKSEAWSTWLSYAWNRNTYHFPTLNPETFPNNQDIRHTVTLGTNYTSGSFKIGVGLNYRTGSPFTQPQPAPNEIDNTVFPNRINYQEPNSSRLPDYFRADASAVYDFDLSETVRASVGASVLNLTNRRNLLNTYYRLNDQNEIEKVESLSLGLTPNLSFRVRF